MEKVKSRLSYIDLMKLLAMFLICMNLFLQRFYIANYLTTYCFSFSYSISLGIFFFVCGFNNVKARTGKELGYYILKTIITYLGPAYLFTVFSIFTLKRFEGYDFSFWMHELFVSTDLFYWFFLTACIINISIATFSYLANKITKTALNNSHIFEYFSIVLGLASVSVIFILMYNKIIPETGPKCLSSDMFLYYSPIAVIGYITRSITFKKMKLKLILMSLFALIWTVIVIFNLDWLGGLKGSFSDIFVRFIGTTSGTLFIFIATKCLSNVLNINKISFFGKYSGPFYLVHVYLVRLLSEHYIKPMHFNVGTTIVTFIYSISFFVISLFITIYLMRHPLTNFLITFDVESLYTSKYNTCA